MFWIVKLPSDSKNLQVNSVSRETVSGNQEVTLFFWVWCSKEGKNKIHFGGMFFLNLWKCRCRVLRHTVYFLKHIFLYAETLWLHFLILIIKYIKYQWAYRRLKSQWNAVANSICAILGAATENQTKVLKKKHSSQLVAFVGVKQYLYKRLLFSVETIEPVWILEVKGS